MGILDRTDAVTSQKGADHVRPEPTQFRGRRRIGPGRVPAAEPSVAEPRRSAPERRPLFPALRRRKGIVVAKLCSEYSGRPRVAVNVMCGARRCQRGDRS